MPAELSVSSLPDHCNSSSKATSPHNPVLSDCSSLRKTAAIDISVAVAMILTSDRVAKIMPSFSLPLSASDARLLYLAAVVSPFAGTFYMEKKKAMPVSKFIIMHSLKVCWLVYVRECVCILNL